MLLVLVVRAVQMVRTSVVLMAAAEEVLLAVIQQVRLVLLVPFELSGVQEERIHQLTPETYNEF
jgi:hypothetical protein